VKVGDLVKFIKVKGHHEIQFAFQVGLITAKKRESVRVTWIRPDETGTTYSHFHTDRFKVISCKR